MIEGKVNGKGAMALDASAMGHSASLSRRTLWNYGATALIWGSAILTCLLLAFLMHRITNGLNKYYFIFTMN